MSLEIYQAFVLVPDPTHWKGNEMNAIGTTFTRGSNGYDGVKDLKLLNDWTLAVQYWNGPYWTLFHRDRVISITMKELPDES